jgi:hypothetical protein
MIIKDCIGSRVETGVFHEGTFGIEIETESKTSYKTPCLSTNKYGQALIDKHGVPIGDMTFWDVKEDGSLRDFGREYVLKVPLRFEHEIPEALDEFEDKTKKITFIENSISTSTHVHVNFLFEQWTTLGNFLTIYTLVENLLVEYSGEYRRNNLFCLPIRSVPVLNQLMIKMFAQVHKKNFDFKKLLAQEHVKYAAGNLATLLRFGSFELRSMRGLTKKAQIYEWIAIINSMLEFSRQNLLPCDIMDIFREKNYELLEDIFGKYWKKIKHKEIDDLIYTKKNLWYAGQLAYSLKAEDWKNLNEKPKPKKFSASNLEFYSLRFYGVPYSKLDTSLKKQLEFYMNEEGVETVT